MIGPSCCSQNVLYNAANRLDEVIGRLAEDRLHALENAMDLINQILDAARRNEDVFRLLLDTEEERMRLMPVVGQLLIRHRVQDI